jgi:metallo-beta-lactamase class B
MKRAVYTVFLVCVAAFLVRAQDRTTWNQPQEPVRMYGNTYYVGTRGLAAILITSADGHVLIDGALPESVPIITGNIRAAGFRVEDVKLILNSHPHWDHAGGIGELARLSGARVAASAPSARVFETGKSGPDDPQHGVLQPIDPVTRIEVVKDGETLRVGSLALTAHATGGHTPGGTSWSWRSCQDGRCLDMVYADSLTAVSADGFLFTRSRDYPDAIADFEKGFATLSALPCDVLMTPHPDASRLWDRIARRTQGVAADPVIDPGACDRLVEGARKGLAARVAREKDGAADRYE